MQFTINRIQIFYKFQISNQKRHCDSHFCLLCLFSIVLYCLHCLKIDIRKKSLRSYYEKIRNVYSIWVCMNAPSDLQNTINEFHTTEHTLFGTGGHNPEDYDLTSIVMICLGAADSYSDGTPDNPNDNSLLQMLNLLFSSNVNPTEKCRILEENYHIPMTETIESEVSTMCNFSEGFFERGLEKGMLEGERQGRLKSLYDLTLSGIITLSVAAQQAGQTEEEFSAGLNTYRDSLKKTVNA